MASRPGLRAEGNVSPDSFRPPQQTGSYNPLGFSRENHGYYPAESYAAAVNWLLPPRQTRYPIPHIDFAMLTRKRSRDVKEATNLKEATKIASLVRNQTEVSYTRTNRRTGTCNLINESVHVVVHAM